MVEAKYHYDVGETKGKIIEAVLSQVAPMKESEIIRFLENNFAKIDRATVNRHANALRTDGCLELISPSKTTTRANRWEIVKLKNLKNVLEKYPSICLNRYDKSLNIIIEEQVNKGFLTSIDSTEAHRLRVQLLLSYSFFEKCLEIGIGSLYAKAYEIDPLGEGFEKDSKIEELVDNLYMKFVNRISITPDIINSSDFVANQDCLKRLTEIQISREKLGEILAATPYNLEFGPLNTPTSKSVNNFLTSITAELHSKFVREIPGNFLLSSKIYHEISINVNDAFEQNAEELEQILYKIKISQYTSREFVPDTIFQHFFESDVIEGVASREEKRFVRETKRIIRLNKEKDLKPELRNALDKFYVEFFNECRKTS